MAPEVQHANVADTEQYWHQLMRQGTVLFEHGDVVGALVNFEQACILARSLAERWDDADDALAAVVVSHLSFSEALLLAYRIEDAAKALCEAHAMLLQIVGDGAAASPAYQSALRHLRHTTAAMLRFQFTHGMRADMQHEVSQAWSCLALLAPSAGAALLSPVLH